MSDISKHMRAGFRIFIWLPFWFVAWNQSSSALAQSRKMTVEPSAVMTWRQLVESGAARSTQTRQRAIPFQATPQASDVGAAPMERAPRRQSTPFADRTASLETPIPVVGGISQDGPTLQTGFEALPDDTLIIPPDTMGAVGPAHVMTMLNTEVAIMNKAGALVAPIVRLEIFWAPTGFLDVFDPRLVYDQGAGRWYAAAVADGGLSTSAILLAVSAGSDPTGAWSFFAIDADPADQTFPDFPDLGFNTTWIALTANMFSNASGLFDNSALWVIDKASALAGGPLTFTAFPTGFDIVNVGGTDTFGVAIRVCTTFGNSPTLYLVDGGAFASGVTALMRLSQITGTGPAPVWSTVPGSSFAGSGLFAVNNNYSLGQIDAAQLGSTTDIETNGSSILDADFRNGKVWCTHSGGLPVTSVDRTAVFWYELDPLGLIATGDPIAQSGVILGNADTHHFFPSIAVNANNDVCIGFSRSDPTRFAEAAFTGRLASDPPGVTDPITVLKAGEDSYVKTFGGTRNRWGDYSSTVVDPSDDLTLWTIQEYAATSAGGGMSDDRWGTWWGSKSAKQTTVKFSQPPSDNEENIASNMDWVDAIPNVVLADDFVSDGRPITCVRWWGSQFSMAALRQGRATAAADDNSAAPPRIDRTPGKSGQAPPPNSHASPRARGPNAPEFSLSLADGPGASSPAADRGVACGVTQITQSLDQSILAGNSAACGSTQGPFRHTDNFYYRAFVLTDHGLGPDFDVCSVEIGVEDADGSQNSQPIEVRLYNTADLTNLNAFTQIGSAALIITDQALTIFDMPVTGTTNTGELTVEIFTPDGNADREAFRIGSNNLGQTAPSYIAAPDCVIPQPTDTAAIGFPDMHIVMNVNGTIGTPRGACCFADGSCAQLPNSNCLAGGGQFLGIGTACADCPPQPFFEIDGWLISFHEPLIPGEPAEPPLGLYFCPAGSVRTDPTAIPTCDAEAVTEYLVELQNCCLIHANPDSRSGGFVPAQPNAFNEEQCLAYDIDIQAVVGHAYVEEPPGSGTCVEIVTGHRSNGDFWGWYSTINENGTRSALASTVTMGAPDEWLYGPWQAPSAICGATNMAFELLTTDLTPPPECCVCLGDVDGDGARDGHDIEGFVNCLLGAAGPGENCGCADMNGVDGPDVNDISNFVSTVLAGTLCTP